MILCLQGCPQMRGLRTTLRVRLLHAAIRRFMPGEAAINQEDLAATLVTSDWTRALIGPYRHLVAPVDVVQDHHALARDLSRELALSWVHGLLVQRLPNGHARFFVASTSF